MWKRCEPDEVVGKLRQAKVLHGQGMAMAEAIRQLGIGEITCCGWRKEYGEVCGSQLGRLKQLEKESASGCATISSMGRFSPRWERPGSLSRSGDLTTIQPGPMAVRESRHGVLSEEPRFRIAECVATGND